MVIKALFLLSVCLVLFTSCSFNKAVRGGEVVDHYDITQYSLPIQEVRYSNIDGTPLYAWFIRKDNYRQLPTIIFLHGSRGNIHDYIPMIENLHRSLNVNIFAPDFPGTGASKGEMSLENAYNRRQG